KSGRGALNFVQALTESCDTWFYQAGIKTGAEPIIDWALKLGFGGKCGIPLRGEAEGRVPNDEYMKATHGRKLLNGDIANLSIGQGDTQVTPLQMAQAMGIEKQRAHRGAVHGISTGRSTTMRVRYALRERGRQQSAWRQRRCADDRGYFQGALQTTTSELLSKTSRPRRNRSTPGRTGGR